MSDDFASRMKRRRAGLKGSGPIRTINYACVCGKVAMPLLGFCSRYCAETNNTPTPLTEEDVNKALRTLKSVEDSLYTGGPIAGGFDGLGVLLDDDI